MWGKKKEEEVCLVGAGSEHWLKGFEKRNAFVVVENIEKLLSP